MIQKESHDSIKTWQLMRVNQGMEKADWPTTTEGHRNTQTTKNNSTTIGRVKWTIKTKWNARNSKENKTHNGKQLDDGGVR